MRKRKGRKKILIEFFKRILPPPPTPMSKCFGRGEGREY
jgi:hypothetical protein